jgi:beta-glucosidase
VRKIFETGKPVVMVLMNGRPLTITWAAANVPSVLETWFLGIQAGNAIADVLFGDANPGGKLPVTFPYTVGQEPIYYNHFNTGRPPSPNNRFTSRYIDAPFAPLFPFGFGLSYTKFSYGDLQLSSKTMSRDGEITVSASVQNTGSVAGDEVVQLYVRDLVASTSRPVKELKGFRRITLAPGERKKVEFTLRASQLRFYDQDMQYVVEPGTFRVWIGPSSAEGSEGSFEVTAR